MCWCWREAEGQSPIGTQLAFRRGGKVGGAGVNVSPGALDRILKTQRSGSCAGKDSVDSSHGASDGQDLVAVHPSQEVRRVFVARDSSVGDVREVPEQTEAGRVEVSG